MRLLGAALILSGSLLVYARLLYTRWRERQALRESIAALEYLSRELSCSLLPLPRLLERRGLGAYADGLFSQTLALHAADGDVPLADCWRAAAERLPLAAPEQETLARIAEAFGGTEEGALAALRGGVSALRAALAERQREERKSGRLAGALCLSGGTLLVILLL